MQQLSQLDYEAIENAVMETARGRWFLSEYKNRHSGASTSTLLDAISRLEKVVTTIGDGSYQSAKPSDVAAPEVSTAPATSPEKVKKFVTPTPFFSGSKEASKEVTKENDTAEQTPLNDENLKFFSNDEDLFSDDANDLLPDASVQNTENLDLASAEAESPIAGLSFADTKIKDVKPVDLIKEATKEAEPEVSTLDAETAEVSDRFKIFRTDTSSDTSSEASVDETVAEENDVTAADDFDSEAVEPALDALFGESAPSDDDMSKPAIEIQEAQAPVVADSVVSDAVVSDPVVSSPIVPDAAIQATDEEKDRIVIIRGNSDKSIDIPFADDIFGDSSDKPSVS